MELNVLWEKHRKFSLQVAGGLAVFLVLSSLAAGLRDGAVQTRDRTRAQYESLRRQLEEKLDIKYARETSARKVLEGRADDLLGRLSIARTARRKPPPEGAEPPTTNFPKALQEVWTDFTDRADKQNLRHPAEREIDFDTRSNLTEREWNDRYHQLEVLERFLGAAVDHQVRAIERIQPGDVVGEPIADNPDLALIRYPVRVQITASYRSILYLMESFQKDVGFNCVEIQEILPSPEDGAGMLSVTLLLVGVSLEEARTQKKSGRRSSGRGWRRKN